MKAVLPKLILLALAVLPTMGTAGTTATVTPDAWDLYRGTSVVRADLPSEAECVNAAKQLNVTRKYTCRTQTGVSVVVTVDPPAPVDCVVSSPVVTSSEWTPAVCPISGSQSRTVTSTRTVLTQPANGGAACPELVTAATETQPCTYIPPIEPPPPVGDVVYASPPTADATVLTPGQTLLLRDGAYTSLKIKAASATAWSTIKAEHDGAVTFPAASLNIGPGNWYLGFEGLKFSGTTSKVVVGSYLKFKRVAFAGGPSTGNDVNVQLGTNDRTPGCSNILVEDSWAYGLGGRYKFLVYNCDKVILRRVTTRHDGGWKYDGQNPQGNITIYDSTNVRVQNSLAVDSVQNLDGYEAAFYLVSNGTTSTRAAGNLVTGSIVVDSPNNGFAAEGQQSATWTITDSAALRSAAGGFNTNGAGRLVIARTFASVKGAPYAAWSGSLSASECVYKGVSNKATVTNCSGTLPALITQRNALGQGATIEYRIGKDGTLFGEPGFEDVTSVSLWPFPNEDRIKADFQTVRPAFGGKSLTEYVRTAP